MEDDRAACALLAEIAALLKSGKPVWSAARAGAHRGVGVLLCGPPGSGKAKAAGMLATAAGGEILRVDLAAVVSKFIGETEKNLAALFDEAERAGAVMLFDEADALFGRRSGIEDAHDRFANIEIAYLLQRLEAFDGLVIFISELRSNLDHAFIRRLRYVVDLPGGGTS